jgi:hypothetical protein
MLTIAHKLRQGDGGHALRKSHNVHLVTAISGAFAAGGPARLL